MLQIEQAAAGEMLQAMQSFAQGLSQAQCNVLMALINGLARNLAPIPSPAPSNAAETPEAAEPSPAPKARASTR